MSIPDIRINGQSIQDIQVNGTGIPLIGNYSVGVTPIRSTYISDTRVWLNNVPQATPIEVPVTMQVGTPVVNMPGCVTVHKENNKRDPSRNKNLVNDDPKGQTTLCDAGAPYFTAPNYDARELTWQTVYQDQEEVDEGVDTGDTGDLTPPETPEPPPQETEQGDPECPGPLDPRIGSIGPNEKEKVVGHELQPDPNNFNKKICVALYEDIGVVEQYLPSAQIATTTAVIASVAASSALLAKPLADLLLRVVKPVVKKVIGKVNAILGKTTYRPSQSEIQADEYRKKKGLPPLKKNQKKKPLKKTPPKKNQS